MTHVSFLLFPFCRVKLLGVTLTDVVLTVPFCTVTLTVAVFLLASVIVIVAVPVFFWAVSFPLLSTFTIAVLLDFQDFT